MVNGRRSLLALVVVLALCAAACGGTSASRGGLGHHGYAAPYPASTAAPDRPNILVIETDDMRWDELRWMPNVRRMIQRDGMDFQNSFAPYPLCCPSRSSFLSGKYAHNHHVFSHVNPYGFKAFDDHTTIATALRAAGYKTGLVGKYLNGYGQQPIRGTHRSSLHYVPPGWDQWYAGSDHAWHAGDRFHGGTYDYFSLVENHNGRVVSFPGKYSASVMGQQARDVLSGFERSGSPWFLWWTPIAPHHGDPFEPDDPGTTVNATGHKVIWLTPARPTWVKGRFDHLITHGLGTPPHHSAEANVTDKPAFLRNNPELLPIERRAETTESRQRAESLYVLDRQIGRTLKALKRSGQYDHTMIVFTSDNGYYLGEHRKRQGKINLHEPSLRVPLLMTGPGIPHGDRFDPVTTIDLGPTFAAAAGAKLPGADGIDLGPLIRSGDRGWTRPVVTEALMPEKRYAMAVGGPGFADPLDTRGIRLGRWKLTVYAPGARELYDLAHDPLELDNLAKKPAYRSLLHKLLRLWREREYCKGPTECDGQVPAAYRLSAAQERAITLAQIAATRRYFSDPGLARRPAVR